MSVAAGRPTPPPARADAWERIAAATSIRQSTATTAALLERAAGRWALPTVPEVAS